MLSGLKEKISYILDNSAIRAKARQDIRGNIPKLILTELFAVALTFAAVILIMLDDILLIVPLIISAMFTVGRASVYLSAARGSYVMFTDIFCGFDQLGPVILTNIWQFISIFLRLLILIVPGFVEIFALALVPYIRAENPDIGAKEACGRSRILMEGHKSDLFFLELSFIPWLILSIATFGLGLIYTLPYAETAHALFYDIITADERACISFDKETDVQDMAGSDM